MLFDFEALDAGEGDCLLLHYGSVDNPKHIIIDGGLQRTWANRLEPRLQELREYHQLDDDRKLAIELVVVTHIDLDHIEGIIEMFEGIADEHAHAGVPWRVERLWHNVFDNDLSTDELARVRRQATGGAAGVGQGFELIELARGRVGSINGPKKTFPRRFVVRVSDTAPVVEIEGLELTVLAPTVAELDLLQTEWDTYLREHPELEAGGAAAVERVTPPNLSSIALLARACDRSVLLCGDTGHQQILAGLAAAGVLEPDGQCSVDVFKISHHGAQANASLELFQRVLAEHYVISANGKHGNPDIETLDLLWEARGHAAETWQIWTTFSRDAFEQATGARRDALRRIQAWFDGHPVRVNYREPEASGLTISLGPERMA
jgi:hypothetical protein